MSKKIEAQENKEVLGNIGTEEELKELKEEIIFHENENSDDGGNEHLDPLDEKPQNIIPISEIGEFDSEGHFNLKEDIKGEDEIGSYILVRGQKYYDATTRSKIEDFKGLGYSILHSDGSESVELGKMNNKGLEIGTKYFKDKILNGNRDLDGHIKGICTLKKFENGKLKYTYKGTFNQDQKYEGTGTMTRANGNKYEGKRKNGKRYGKGKQTYRNGVIYDGEWKNNKREGICSYFKDIDGDIFYNLERKNDKVQASNGHMEDKFGNTYDGFFLIDSKGEPIPFYHNLEKTKEMIQESGQLEGLPKNMHGEYKGKDGKRHKYTLTNSSIKEEGNRFITMYGDEKPNEQRDDERGEVMYFIDYSAEPLRKYELTSWQGHRTTWKFDGNSYKFTNKQGKTLSLPSSIGEKGAMNIANIINKLIYEYKKHNRTCGFGYDKDKNIYFKYAKNTRDTCYDAPNIIEYKNGTKALDGKKFSKRFGNGTSVKNVTIWLNGLVGISGIKGSNDRFDGWNTSKK